MKQGYNKELAINASCRVLGIDKLQNPTFDKKGNVIRDYNSELNIYVKHEEHFVLPSYEGKYFDGHDHYKKFVKSQSANFIPIVNPRPLAEIPETKKKTSAIELFAIGANYLFSKFIKSPKNKLVPEKGYFWIYFQMKTAYSCKRKIAS